MASTYGNMLAFFPELMREYEIFSMAPRIGAGYGKRHNFRKVWGYLSKWKGGKMDVQGDLRSEDDRGSMWVQCGGSDVVEINQGDFIEHKGKLYVIGHDDDAEEEGGFRQYDIQLVVGPTDQQVPNRDVDVNIRSDYE